MSSHDFARRVPKRRRTNKLLSQLLPDLNSLPAEGADDGGSPSSSVLVSHAQTSAVAVAGTSQYLVPAVVAGPHIGMSSCPIIVDDINDDVVIYSASSFPQVRQQAPRTEPVVTIEDDSETTPGQAGTPARPFPRPYCWHLNGTSYSYLLFSIVISFSQITLFIWHQISVNCYASYIVCIQHRIAIRTHSTFPSRKFLF
jgi:hypothetical protein